MECINVSCACLISRLKGKICSSEKTGLVRALYGLFVFILMAFFVFLLFYSYFSGITIHFAGKNSETAMGRDYFFRLGVPVKGYTGAYIRFFGVFSLFIFAGMNSEASMGRAACFYETFWPVSRPLIFQGRKYFYFILPPKNLTW
jgi:hypothetical protein